MATVCPLWARSQQVQQCPIPPEQLALQVPEVVWAEAGEPFALPYQVTRQGGRPDRPLTVEAEKAGGPLELTTSRREHSSVGTGQAGELDGVAAEPGQYQVAVTARGGYNEPSRVVLVDVQPPRGAAATPGRLLAAGALVVVALATIRLPLRRRRPGSP